MCEEMYVKIHQLEKEINQLDSDFSILNKTLFYTHILS